MQSRCQYPTPTIFAAKLTASGSFHQCGGFPSLVALFYPNVPSTDSVIKKPL